MSNSLEESKGMYSKFIVSDDGLSVELPFDDKGQWTIIKERCSVESFEEPEEYPEDETPSRIKLSDEDLIKKLDEIILNPGSADKTLWVKL